MTVDRDPQGMAILEKTGAVLRALEALGEASAQQIADHATEPVSSTYRLLASLMSLGWVDQGSKRGRFRLGVRVMRIGSALDDLVSVRDACRPALAALRAQTHTTAFLCFRRGDEAVCVDRIAGRDVHSLAMRLGDALPLNAGAAPLALLSFLPFGEREGIVARFAAAAADDDADAGSRLLARIAETRERGYSISDEDVTPGIAAVGAPVFNHRGELEAAISISGLRWQVLDGTERAAQLVTEAALASSRALGFEQSHPSPETGRNE